MANDVSYFKVQGDNTQYSFNDADAELSKLSLAGGTMTGRIRMLSTGITDGTQPSANTFGLPVEFVDSSGTTRIGAVQPFASAAGRQGLFLAGYQTVNGTAVVNSISLLVDEDGNQFVNLTNADAWLTALGLSDSGWQVVGTTAVPFGSGFKNYGTTNLLRFRKVGKVVQVTGIVTTTALISSDAAAKTIFTLPSAYRPADQFIYIRCQGSGTNTWLCSISQDGPVAISRYGTTTASDIPIDAWLPISATFLTA